MTQASKRTLVVVRHALERAGRIYRRKRRQPRACECASASVSKSPNNESDRMTIKHIGKFCSGAAIALVVITALGPRQLAAPHVTRLGDRPLGYFAITLPVCFAWPRPVIVGGALMVFAALLGWLQGLTPDRTSNLQSHLLVVRSLQLCRIAHIDERCGAPPWWFALPPSRWGTASAAQA